MANPVAGDGFVTVSEGIRQLKIKSGVTLAPGDAFVFTATNDEIDLPAGANATIAGGFVRIGGVGTAAGVYADVYLKGFGQIVYVTASAAIAAGKDLGTAGANGKVAVTTTAGAKLAVAFDNAAADGDLIRVIV